MFKKRNTPRMLTYIQVQHSIFILHRNTLTGCVSPGMRTFYILVFETDLEVTLSRDWNRTKKCLTVVGPSSLPRSKPWSSLDSMKHQSNFIHAYVRQWTRRTWLGQPTKKDKTGAVHQKKKLINSTVIRRSVQRRKYSSLNEGASKPLLGRLKSFRCHVAKNTTFPWWETVKYGRTAREETASNWETKSGPNFAAVMKYNPIQSMASLLSEPQVKPIKSFSVLFWKAKYPATIAQLFSWFYLMQACAYSYLFHGIAHGRHYNKRKA